MKELANWLERLSHLGATRSPSANMHRVAAPSAVHFDDSIVRFQDGQQRVSAFGSLPVPLSVMVWPDEESSLSFQSQVVASELGALLTLALNRRVQVSAAEAPLNLEGSTNRFFLPIAYIADSTLIAPIDVDVRASLEHRLAQVGGLRDFDRAAIGEATDLHYASALLYDIDLNASYALAVAGIERLSRAYGTDGSTWADWEQATRFDEIFTAIELNEHQAGTLRRELVKDRQLRLRQTFANYVIAALPGRFWTERIPAYMPQVTMMPDGSAEYVEMTFRGEDRVDSLLARDTKLLKRRLLRSYDARSGYVHQGTRGVGLLETIRARVPASADDSGPIDYAVLRAILRSLVLRELDARSDPIVLPDIKMFHGASPIDDD